MLFFYLPLLMFEAALTAMEDAVRACEAPMFKRISRDPTVILLE